MATRTDPLADLLAEYDTWLRVERGLAPNSLAAYRRDLDRYAAYLRRRGQSDPGAVSEAVVAAYVEDLRDARDDDGRARYAPSSIARAVAAVRSFHRFCVEEGLVALDPSEDIGGPRVPQGIPKALDRGRGGSAAGRRYRATTRGASRSRHPRDALRRWAADQRARRARSERPRSARRHRARARQGQQGTRRAGRAHGARPRSTTISATGVRSFERGDTRASARATRCSSTRAAGSSHARALAHRARGRRPRRPRGPPLPARPPALLRDPHARPRGRHPRGPGAARPRQPLDHPGVHPGLPERLRAVYDLAHPRAKR